MQTILEEIILCKSIVREDNTINYWIEIYLRTTQKWLNRLGYKWKEVQKKDFFDGHKYKIWLNIVKISQKKR